MAEAGKDRRKAGEIVWVLHGFAMQKTGDVPVSAACGGNGIKKNESEEFKMDKRKTRGMGLVATVLMVISFFLPFLKASAFGFSDQASLMSQDGGAAMLIFAVVALLVTIVGKPKAVIVGGIFDLAVMIIAVIYAMGQAHGVSVKLLVGFWLYIAACILLIIAGVKGKAKNNRNDAAER